MQAKIAIITGGGSGIGRAACLAFAAAGYQVVVAGRTRAKVEAVAAEIVTAGGAALAREIDVARAADNERLIAATVERFGGVDTLFCSAGFRPDGGVVDADESDWDHAFAVNVTSIFFAAKYAIPVMRARGGGAILVNAGTFGIRPARGKAAYAASKAAAINLARSIALDYARDNVRCNAICPGYVDTPFNADFPAAGVAAFLDEFQPLPGMIQPEEVAAMAVYLASDAAKMITGQVFVVDGGQQAGIFR
ncbi:MAG: SDR family oxidoreductase [Chloroflexota bacterium]|nr:SDR family oxidoreductase [Chloroflexota bacterium]